MPSILIKTGVGVAWRCSSTVEQMAVNHLVVSSILTNASNAAVAQLVEHRTCNATVESSSLSSGSKCSFKYGGSDEIGRHKRTEEIVLTLVATSKVTWRWGDWTIKHRLREVQNGSKQSLKLRTPCKFESCLPPKKLICHA